MTGMATATFFQLQAQRLVDGVDASAVLDALRARYTTAASMQWAISKVRARVFDADARHPAYDVAPLRAVADGDAAVLAFLDAPLREQVKIQREHRSAPSWTQAQEDALAAVALLPDGVAALALTHSQSIGLKRAREARLVEKNRALTVIDADLVLRCMLDLLNRASPAQPYAKLVVPLLLVTGRRLSEICGRATLEPVPDITHHAVFTGQLKTKSTVPRPYRIPLLAPSPIVQRALAALRAKQGDLAGLTTHEVKVRFQSNVQRGIEMGKVDAALPSFHIHELRAMYASLVHHCFVSPWSFAATTAAVLGHASLHESLNYSNVRLENADAMRGCLGALRLA